MVAPIITFVFALALALVAFMTVRVDTGMEEVAPPAVEESSEEAEAEEAEAEEVEAEEGDE